MIFLSCLLVERVYVKVHDAAKGDDDVGDDGDDDFPAGAVEAGLVGQAEAEGVLQCAPYLNDERCIQEV